MALSLQKKTRILHGNRIEIFTPEIPEGSLATVIIMVDEQVNKFTKRKLSEVLAGYTGQQLFKSAQDVKAYLQAERDLWDK